MAAKRKPSGFSLYDSDDEEELKSKEVESTAAAVAPSKSEDGLDLKKVKQEKPFEADNELKETPAHLVTGLGCRRGEREEMQDAHSVLDGFARLRGITRSALYAIYDGHAGARASSYAEHHLPDAIRTRLQQCSDFASSEKSLRKIFIDSFKTVDDAFLKEAKKNKPVWKDGSTVTTVLLLNDALYSANIGDSKAIVCRLRDDGSPSVIELTVDHSATSFDERMRVQKAGGVVKDGRIMGILEVSRSLGDGALKAHGVSCTPDIKKLSITDKDKFLLIGCDGLWKAFSNDDAVAFVRDRLDKAGKEATECGWQRVSEELAAEAVRRKCGDNVSVLLVRLNQ